MTAEKIEKKENQTRNKSDAETVSNC